MARSQDSACSIAATCCLAAPRLPPLPRSAPPHQFNPRKRSKRQVKSRTFCLSWVTMSGGSTSVAYHQGIMGGKTPNLDRIAAEGMRFTDYYAEASCTAGRANFITGQIPLRTGLTTVGQAGADV